VLTEPTSPSHQPWGRAKLVGVTVSVTEAVRVTLPEVPVTVTVKPPVRAVLLAARVSVLVPVVLLGLKKALMPLGKPDALKATLPVNPFWGVTVMVLPPLEPCVRLMLIGEAESVKFGVAFTVRLIVVVPAKLPEFPVIVMVTVPAVAALLAESVSVLVVELPPELNRAVTPAGRPDADKLTLPEKPPWGVTVIVLVPLAPCTRVMLLGEAERVKP
jgi:hypothetical protein